MLSQQPPNKTKTREQLLEELLKTCQQVFAIAEKQGLYVGAKGYATSLTGGHQGTHVKKLRRLIEKLTVGGQ